MDKIELKKKAEELLPPACGLTKIELEGPDVAVYLTNPEPFYETEENIKNLSRGLRKKILVRCDADVRKSPEETLAVIKSLITEEAGVGENDIIFIPEFGEVVINAIKPGLVIGKGGSNLKEIMVKTHWAARVQRSPTIPSNIIRGIRGSEAASASERKKFLSSFGKKVNVIREENGVEWVKAVALGSFKEIGRSCLLVQTNKERVIIDVGMNNDTTDPSRAYPYLDSAGLAIQDIDAVIISHAHTDHSGFLPYLFKLGYDGPVFCTPPTRDLMTLLQFDIIKVMNMTGKEAPYSDTDVRKTVAHTITRNYEEVTDVTPNMKLTFRNAGHILGSSTVHLHIGDGKHNLVFSGDIRYTPSTLFEPADTRFPRVETLFLESTYGGKNDLMPRSYERDQNLFDSALETLKNGGKVLIPVFSVGRSQEVMLTLEKFVRGKEAEFPYKVYIDGMILETTAFHTAYPEYLKSGVQRRILSDESPFESPIFEPVKKKRKDIVEGDPCIILAPSGMLTGGPSNEYLKLMAEDPRNSLFFVGYQSPTSIGRKIQNGEKEIHVTDDNGRIKSVGVNMQNKTIEGFSGHSDRRQLIAFVRDMNQSFKNVFTMHGESGKCDEMARTINYLFKTESRAPMNMDAFRIA
jgi:KH/beta-lactamase-domain protein